MKGRSCSVQVFGIGLCGPVYVCVLRINITKKPFSVYGGDLTDRFVNRNG